MDATSAPAVVAVVVTRDPGPWLEDTLGALAGQDYSQLVTVVLDAGGAEDPTGRVAQVAPEAFVRRIPEPLGFGAASNEVLGLVEGAAYFLFCHDDCAPDPSAVRLLVEESFRSNAGIVSPKVVSWDDPLVLLHVGMNADKTGAVVDRVQSPEIDAGQHDGVREVFVAPSGCTLVRADLMSALGGFDTVIVAMAEDLDLSWRAQVAGARVIVAPDVRVRHLEVIAPGVTPVLRGADAGATLQALQRRHELRTVLKCYSTFNLLRVLPQIAVLNLGEVLVALVARDRGRARAVTGAWRWNFAHRQELRRARDVVQRSRQVHDALIRHNQIRGSARLSEYLSNVSHLGFEVTHARVGALSVHDDAEEPELTATIAGAFSEDDTFDEDWDDRGRFAPRGPRRHRILVSRRSRLIVGLVTALLLAIGARGLFGGAFPLVGQFATLSSWSGTWHQFLASWQPAGVGTTAPASPAFAALGALGTVLLGGMGLAQKLLILGSIPVGAWGVSRLLAPFASPRARLAGALSYLGLPLAYNALAHGRLDGLVAFGLAPWVISALMRATAVEPYDGGLGRHGRPGRMQLLGLGVVLAVGIAFAPALAIAVLLAAAGMWLGSAVLGRTEGAGRGVRAALGGIVVALVLCLPWVVGTALGGPHALSVFGLPSAGAGAPGWGALLRFDVGPVGGSPFSWLLPVAALLPLAIASGPRLDWATRLWGAAVVSWLAAWVVGRGWTHSFAPSPLVLLAPAAVAVAASVGLGVAAFESDLVGQRFGWRQLAASLMSLAALGGLIPVVAEVSNGRFGLPGTGFDAPLQFLAARPPASYRVLWLGDPAALPLGGWSIAPGLAFATTEDGLPGADDLFAPVAPGPAGQLAQAVELARHGQTVHLGRLLAPAGIRYVVLVNNLAPSIPGVQSAPAFPLPADLMGALQAQADLREVPGQEGFVVFTNTSALPLVAARALRPVVGVEATSGPAAGLAVPSPGDLQGWRPVLPGQPGAEGFFGRVGAGTIYAGLAPGGDFQLAVAGAAARAAPAFGWATQFTTQRAGPAALRFAGPPWPGLGGVAEILLWLVVLGTLLDRRFSIRARLRAVAAARPSETTVRPPVSARPRAGPAHQRRRAPVA